MRRFEIQTAMIRREMEKGRGGDRIYDHPVPLEPSFRQFSHDIRVTHQENHQPEDGLWNPVGLPTDRYHPAFLTIRAGKEDRILPELAEQFINLQLQATLYPLR